MWPGPLYRSIAWTPASLPPSEALAATEHTVMAAAGAFSRLLLAISAYPMSAAVIASVGGVEGCAMLPRSATSNSISPSSGFSKSRLRDNASKTTMLDWRSVGAYVRRTRTERVMQRIESDAAYFKRRAREEYEHASEAQTIEAEVSHRQLAAKYEDRALKAQMTAGLGATAFPQLDPAGPHNRWRDLH